MPKTKTACFYVMIDDDQTAGAYPTLEEARTEGRKLADAEPIPCTFSIQDENGEHVEDIERTDGASLSDRVAAFSAAHARPAATPFERAEGYSFETGEPVQRQEAAPISDSSDKAPALSQALNAHEDTFATGFAEGKRAAQTGAVSTASERAVAKNARRLLDLSTSHVTQETAEMLEGRETIKRNDDGFLIPVYPEAAAYWDEDGAPELANIVRFAEARGFSFVLLDKDAPTCDAAELPVFDW